MTSLPTEWRDNKEIYPSPEVIADALQDLGRSKETKSKGRTVKETKYPKMEKMCTGIYKKIQMIYKPVGFTTNQTRGSKALIMECLLCRKHKDIFNCEAFFHPYGKEGKVYVITNDPIDSGLSIAIKGFQDHVELNAKQKNAARTPNDGLRLAGILMDPQHRSPVSGIMSKTDTDSVRILGKFPTIC